MSLRNFRERSPIIIGIISMLAIAGGTMFAFSIDKIPALKQVYEIKGEFADAAGIVAENQVRVAGIKVGTVSEVELAGDRVLITMEIENGIEIPRDASAEIKLATLLGTKFVDIEADGGSPYMTSGDVIPLERTDVPYEIYQAANQGTAVVEEIDGELLNDLLEELTKLTKVTQDEVGEALSGLNELGAGLNAKSRNFESLLSGAEDLTRLLADEGDEIVDLVDSSNIVLGSLASKREELQSLLEATRMMAGELTQVVSTNREEVDSILRKLHRAMLVLERNVEHLDMTLEYIGPAVRYSAQIVRQGPWVDIYVCQTIINETCEFDE